MPKVEVIAKVFGQKADGSFMFPGDRFEVDTAEVSYLAMKRADGKPWPEEKTRTASDEENAGLVEKLRIAQEEAATSKANADRADRLESDLTAAQEEIATLKDQLATAQSQADEAEAQDKPESARKAK